MHQKASTVEEKIQKNGSVNWKTVVEITDIEQEEKSENGQLRDLRDNIKYTNIHTIGVPEGEKRKDLRKYLKR